MKIFVTAGIGGEKVENLGEVKTSKQVWKTIYKFKDKAKDSSKILKVETYDRILKLSQDKLAIDFGDYSRFILVEADQSSKKDMKEIQEVWHPSSEK